MQPSRNSPFTIHHSPFPRAFTLLELLIVVSIIVVLLAIMLPNLAAAKKRTRTVACASNLRSLGLATACYVDDNAGYYPRYYLDLTIPAAPVAGRLWWFGFEAGGPGNLSNRPLDKNLSPLAPFTASLDNRLLCPEFPYEDPLFFSKFDKHAASYGFNWNVGPYQLNRPAHRQNFVDRAPNVFLFADAVQFESLTKFNEGFYIQYNANVSNPNLGLDGYAHFRHNKRAQLVYLDGHVDDQLLKGPAFRKVAGANAGNLSPETGPPNIYGN